MQITIQNYLCLFFLSKSKKKTLKDKKTNKIYQIKNVS